ncbi:MAG: flagellar hook-length control protein FliK [Spongiibacteraceae bacterium]
MTPTATSSSILLLNPAASTAANAQAVDAQAAPDAGLSGFRLLLGAMQQLQQELTPQALVDANAPSAEGEAPASGGNDLPQLGTLLPSLLPLSGKAAEAAGDAPSVDGSAESMIGKSAESVIGKKAGKGKKGDEVDADLLFSATSSSAVQSATPIDAGATGEQSTLDPATGNAGADALALQAAAVGVATGAIKADAATSNVEVADKASKATRGSAVSLQPAFAEADINTSDSVRVDSNTPPVQDTADVAANAESDFDILVKHFETSTSLTSQTTSAQAGTNSSLVNHASRTYSNAMNSNAAIPVPVGSEGWGDAVADKVMWFSANKISSAEIHLNPPDLGPLQVRVSTQQDQASVVFTSQHAAVRDALDQALPRLRDMMGSQGMQLLDVSVGGQASQQQQQFTRNDSQQSSGQFAGLFGDDAAESKPANVTNINTARLLRSGFDTYA